MTADPAETAHTGSPRAPITWPATGPIRTTTPTQPTRNQKPDHGAPASQLSLPPQQLMSPIHGPLSTPKCWAPIAPFTGQAHSS